MVTAPVCTVVVCHVWQPWVPHVNRVRLLELHFFFSSSVADVALRLGPYMRVSRKYTVQGHRVLKVGKAIKTTKPEPTKTKKTTRKSPSQTCVSPAETAKQQQKNQTKHTKNRAGAQTKTPTESICHWTQWYDHCLTIKNMQNELWIAAVQADMKTLARE